MQSPDGFFYMSGPLQRTAEVNSFDTSSDVGTSIVGR